VEVLSGDVTLEGFGLDEDTRERLASSLDLIVHTAAATSLTADRALCDSVNRDGTARMLMFAERCFSEGRLKRFAYLSTALVAGAESRAVAYEDELLPSPRHANYYEWSKYDAERIVRAAMRAGLPVTIFRPSMVVGDTRTGETRDFNVIYPLMRIIAAGHITRFPADPQASVHIVPRDFVVDRIMGALEVPWSVGATFHLTASNPPRVDDLFSCDAFFPPGASRPHLCPLAGFDPTECPSRERELLGTMSFCFPYFNSRVSFDTTNVRRLGPLPVTDGEYLARLGRFAVESGYMRFATV
jgi:long-chain acyl-CoA synthetase